MNPYAVVLFDFNPSEPRNDDRVAEEASLYDEDDEDGREREVGGSVNAPRPRHSSGIGREIRTL